MQIAVKLIKLIILLSLLLSCSCRVDSTVDDGLFANDSDSRLSEKFKIPVSSFFRNLRALDLEKVYEFAAPEYRGTVPFETFERFFEKGWKLKEVEILSSSSFENSFYILIRTISETGNETTLSYDAMFWRVNRNDIEFINFPFSSSGAPPYGEIPSFFE